MGINILDSAYGQGDLLSLRAPLGSGQGKISRETTSIPAFLTPL